MRALNKDEVEVQEILDRGGVWSSVELADETGLKREKVRSVVHSLRTKFLDNHTEVFRYILTTKGGYTIDEKAEHVMYEARSRLALGTGVLLNGVYVFKRGRKIALKNFGKLRIEYKQKLLEIGKVV